LNPDWRLLVVSEPGRDGVLTCVSTLIRHVHANHPEIGVDFLYSSRRGGVELEELVAEVRARDGEAQDLHVGNAPEMADFAAMRRIFDLVRRRQPSIVHAHSSKAGALVRLGALWPGFPPVLYSPHAYYGMPRRGGKKEIFFNLLETLLGRIGWTHNCSEDERDFARDTLHVPPERLKVVHNGVDTAWFSPADTLERESFRRELGLPEKGKILATIGRDSPQKNFAPLYAGLGRLLAGSDWSFAHAGAGSVELRAALPEAALPRCHAYCHLNDTAHLLRAADGFILTSRYEGLSLSMLHALSCGLPLILTDAPGFRVLKTLGFQNIHWLPEPGVEGFERHLDAALKEWAAAPSQVLMQQRIKACEFFTESIQMEKLVNLYHVMLR